MKRNKDLRSSELDAADLPARPSDELIRWAGETLLNKHVMLYRAGWSWDPLTDMKEACVDARCSYCGHVAKYPKVPAGSCGRTYARAPYGFLDQNDQPVISGNDMICPHCGQPVTAKYHSDVRDIETIASSTPMEVVSIKDRLVLVFWKTLRVVDDYGKESLVAYCDHAYVVEKTRIKCFSGDSYWSESYSYKDRSGRVTGIYPWDPNILTGTTAENSKLDLYLSCPGDLYPVSYLRIWVDRPRIENLLVQGAGRIVADMIHRDCKPTWGYGSEVNIPHLKDVNWRDKRPAQMLGLNKVELKCAANQSWSLEELETYKLLRDREKVDCATDMIDVRKCGLGNVKHLLTHQMSGTVMRSVRYLMKQRKRDAVTLVDYWNLLVQNGENSRDSRVRYPQNLKRAHDQQSERQKFEAKRGYPEAFKNRVAQLSALAFEADGLLIRPVESAEELYAEGKKLSHCVYSYLKRHASGETSIFLIRKKHAPKSPFFTLELNLKNMIVTQNRGKNNCARTPEVRAFEDKWLLWAKEQNLNQREENVV